MKAKLIPSKWFTYVRLLHLCAAPILVALFLLGLPAVSRAQDTGYITGTVADTSGAAVVGAKVVIATVTGNLSRETVTNADGVYNVPGLPGATYVITVTAPGFQKYTAQRVVLDVAQKARVDVQMQVGTVTQEVIVSGENVAQVETQSAELSTTITGKQVDRLELNGRNFTQLVTLVPGVVNQTGADEGEVGIIGNVQYSINGGRTEYNNWEIDGGDNMDNGSNTSLNVYPNLEAIAEFKVLTSNYGAQYGRNASGTVEVELKSGTSDFHGSAFEYIRNAFFNANSWQDNGTGLARPEYNKNDFGGTIGGPLYIPHVYNNDKKKTFFFYSQEFRRETVPSSNGAINQPVPSNAERMGNFNDVCPAIAGPAQPFDTTAFPECPFQSGSLNTNGQATSFPMNTVPITSTAAAELALIPQANNFSGINGTYFAGQAAGQPIPSFTANPSYYTGWYEELVRVDHNITDNERLAIHYIHDSWSTTNQGPLWGVVGSSFDNTNTAFKGPTTSFVARLTSNLTPTLLNEFVASYTADHINLTELGAVGIPSAGIDLVPLFENGLGGKLPAIAIGNTNQNEYGNGFTQDTGYFPWKNANPTYTYRDNMTKIHGVHTFVFGAYFAAAQKNQQSTVNLQGELSFAASNPNSTGNPFADFLTGQVAGYNQTSAQPYFYDRYKIFEPYFQDDWRVTKKFTLNLGLRWSFFGRYQEKFDQEYGFSTQAFMPAQAPQFNLPSSASGAQTLVPGSGNIFNGIIQCGAANGVTGCEKNKYVNPGPRIGFAWDPLGDGKWAIRGGYGIFFEHANGNEANAESLQNSPSPNVLNGSVSNIPGYANVGAAAATGAVSPLNPVSIPDNVQWPYVQQWNLDIQHELPGHIIMQVAYVGSRGTHLVQTEDLNQLHTVSAANNPYPTGVPITQGDCSSIMFDQVTGFPTTATISTGTVVTGPALTNLAVACGNALADYSRPFQGYGSITRIENEANSNYNALQVAVDRTVGDLTFSASYTYSHSLDNSSDRYDPGYPNSYAPSAGYASSNFDQRHTFELSYTYAFPFFKAAGLKHTLLGGWQASGITVVESGLPFYVTDGSAIAPDNAGVANGVAGFSYLDVVGNPGAVTQAQRNAVAAAGVFGVLNYNPAAFNLPTGLTFGDSGRNELRLPGRTNFDFGLFKRFAFKERYAFEFRWENFNVFNHTQLNQLNGSQNSNGAGLGTSDTCAVQNAGDPSCAGQGFLVLDGAHNPRIMQFGLRFQF